jgi:hypothetical protein
VTGKTRRPACLFAFAFFKEAATIREPHRSLVSGFARCDSNPRCGFRRKSTVYGLTACAPTSWVHLNPQPHSALLLLRPLSVGRKAGASLSAKKYGRLYFSAEANFKNMPEAALSSSSFSVSEKLARYEFRVSAKSGGRLPCRYGPRFESTTSWWGESAECRGLKTIAICVRNCQVARRDPNQRDRQSK